MDGSDFPAPFSTPPLLGWLVDTSFPRRCRGLPSPCPFLSVHTTPFVNPGCSPQPYRSGCFVVGFEYPTVAVQHLTTLSGRCQDFREVRTPLWSTQFPVYALVFVVRFAVSYVLCPLSGSLGFRRLLFPNARSFLFGTPCNRILKLPPS